MLINQCLLRRSCLRLLALLFSNRSTSKALPTIQLGGHQCTNTLHQSITKHAREKTQEGGREKPQERAGKGWGGGEGTD